MPSEPWIFLPLNVLPFKNALVSPATNPVFEVLKWHARSTKPSSLTCSPPGLQKDRLASLPVWPKVSELVFTSVTAFEAERGQDGDWDFPLGPRKGPSTGHTTRFC
jgi:hypothetical protein